MKSRYSILAILIILALSACNTRPDYVLSPNKMATVLADLHVGESVVDMNHMDYNSDSAKLLLKQSIYAANGVTQADFDTSMVWYAHHMDKYMDVCEREIKILEERSANAGSLMMEMAMSMGGDSVDVWGGSKYAIISDRFPNRNLSFDFNHDENMDSGDYYIWRIKLIDVEDAQVSWSLLANYADSTCEFLTMQTSAKGWNEATFYTDSTKQIVRMRGMLSPNSTTTSTIYVDSIQLIRKRVDRQKYSGHYRQRMYPELYPRALQKAIELKDSIDSISSSVKSDSLPRINHPITKSQHNP